jgi:hypothetical protein
MRKIFLLVLGLTALISCTGCAMMPVQDRYGNWYLPLPGNGCNYEQPRRQGPPYRHNRYPMRKPVPEPYYETYPVYR